MLKIRLFKKIAFLMGGTFLGKDYGSSVYGVKKKKKKKKKTRDEFTVLTPISVVFVKAAIFS